MGALAALWLLLTAGRRVAHWKITRWGGEGTETETHTPCTSLRKPLERFLHLLLHVLPGFCDAAAQLLIREASETAVRKTPCSVEVPVVMLPVVYIATHKAKQSHRLIKVSFSAFCLFRGTQTAQEYSLLYLGISHKFSKHVCLSNTISVTGVGGSARKHGKYITSCVMLGWK
jgi:hypothetical protein